VHALGALFASDNYAGYGLGGIGAIIFIITYAGSEWLQQAFPWPIALLTFVLMTVIPGLLYRMFPTGDELYNDAPKRKCTKYTKWVIGAFVIALLVFAWFLKVLSDTLILAIGIFLLLQGLIEHFLGKKSKPISNKTMIRTSVFFIVLCMLIMTAYTVYVFLPAIMPLIASAIG